MQLYRAALVVISAGLLTFGVVFTVLQVTRSEAAPGQVAAITPAAEPAVTVPRQADSVAPMVARGRAIVGVPIGGSEALLRDVQQGDRLDVLASVPSAADGRPITAVLVRGATVVRPALSSDPLLIDVSSADAIVLAHLVLGGTHLGYAVWPAGGGTPSPQQPLDERTARALLGLAPSPEPTVPPAPAAATPAPTPVPLATAVPSPPALAPTSGFIYQVQPGETWDSVANSFNMSADDLRRWNEAAPDVTLTPGTILFVPRRVP
ncbi:MAG TPA: LysM domain-containing protein [Chloroflexota bacterium]|nr:LysM domain-containing protein [Chloroflexota bacterium]